VNACVNILSSATISPSSTKFISKERKNGATDLATQIKLKQED